LPIYFDLRRFISIFMIYFDFYDLFIMIFIFFKVAFTTDGWTSRNNDPYESLTLHYVSKDFELKKLSLDCQNFIKRKTGILLAKGFDSMISKYPMLTGPNLTRVCVTDGAANIKSAISLSTLIPKGNHLICADHNLNNCLQVN